MWTFWNEMSVMNEKGWMCVCVGDTSYVWSSLCSVPGVFKPKSNRVYQPVVYYSTTIGGADLEGKDSPLLANVMTRKTYDYAMPTI